MVDGEIGYGGDLESADMDSLLDELSAIQAAQSSLRVKEFELRSEIGRRAAGGKRIETGRFAAVLEYPEHSFRQSDLRELACTNLGRVYIRVASWAVNKAPSGHARLADFLDLKTVAVGEAAGFRDALLRARVAADGPPRVKIVTTETTP